MTFKLKTTSRFEKDFLRLDRHIKIRIDEAILGLGDNPYLGKPLRGEFAGKWSLRVGDYRVIYAIDNETASVLLYTVQHRSIVYE